jgi:hypothetical protein
VAALEVRHDVVEGVAASEPRDHLFAECRPLIRRVAVPTGGEKPLNLLQVRLEGAVMLPTELAAGEPQPLESSGEVPAVASHPERLAVVSIAEPDEDPKAERHTPRRPVLGSEADGAHLTGPVGDINGRGVHVWSVPRPPVTCPLRFVPTP